MKEISVALQKFVWFPLEIFILGRPLKFALSLLLCNVDANPSSIFISEMAHIFLHSHKIDKKKEP